MNYFSFRFLVSFRSVRRNLGRNSRIFEVIQDILWNEGRKRYCQLSSVTENSVSSFQEFEVFLFMYDDKKLKLLTRIANATPMERIAAGVNRIFSGSALRKPSKFSGFSDVRPSPKLTGQQMRLVWRSSRYQHTMAELLTARIHSRQQHFQLGVL